MSVSSVNGRMDTPRRRSARILKKVTSESEASDINTDDELTLLTQTPTTHRRLKKPSKRTPAKSTVKTSQAERVPETVYEQAEETEDTAPNVSDKVTSPKSSKRRIENVIKIVDNEDQFSLQGPIVSPKKSPKKKSKSPLKSAEEEFAEHDEAEDEKDNKNSLQKPIASPKKNPKKKLNSPLKHANKEFVKLNAGADDEEEDEDCLQPNPIVSPKKSPKKKLKSPLKPAGKEFMKLDVEADNKGDEDSLSKPVTSPKKSPRKSPKKMLKSHLKPAEEDFDDKADNKLKTSTLKACNIEEANITKEENQPCNTKIQIETKKKPRFKVDLKKYEDNNSTSPLLILRFELKNSSIFKDHFQQIKNKGMSSQKMAVNDICGLDGIQLEESVKKEPELETNLDIKKSSRSKDSSDNQVAKLMKKSVLPPDMEKEKNCPVFNKSKYSIAKERKKQAQETAGPGWYNMPKTELTDEVKRDLQVLKMRKVLNTKQHYKREDSKAIPKFFQMGTIIEGSHEYYSSRISKKERKRTMVDELLADSEFRKKNKKRMIEYEMRKGAGGKGHHKNKTQKRKPSKQRT